MDHPHAVFSVYDGIQWHTVESKFPIPEKWTHLAATFNGTSIGIYVNGVLENSEPISKVGISISGQLETKTIENIQSSANVIIGAQQTLLGTQTTVQGLFGGQIDEVSTYKSVLSAQEIQQSYLQNAVSINNAAIPSNITSVVPSNIPLGLYEIKPALEAF